MKRLLPWVVSGSLFALLVAGPAFAKDCMGGCVQRCTDDVTACTTKCSPPQKQEDSGRYAACSKECADRSQACFQRCSSRCSGK